uniref:Nitrilase and fragile histidine triad fusion protein NitFhit n=1 Tax=Syphacia muris TaxID=451379 RepID=A0A0N5A7V0_9BILA
MFLSLCKYGERGLRKFTMAKSALVAVCQMTSTHDPEDNFIIANQMMTKAKERNAQMVFFPESFDYIGRDINESISMAHDENGEYIGRFRKRAKELGLWLSLGGFHEKNPDGKQLPFNTQLIIDNEGKTRGKYRKLHIFDLEIPGKVRLMESEFSTRGDKLCDPVNTPIGCVGMNICYDIRFAELGIWYRKRGAQILTYPAAFTIPTGIAHWETLVRARAAETQCYVIAAAQCGTHNLKRASYGHSVVVDPWGEVIAQCSDTVGMCFAETSLDYLEEIRKRQPLFDHRRCDLYSLATNFEHLKIFCFTGITELRFGDNIISPDVVFVRTPYSFAFVNHKPVLPGHVLVSPIRMVHRLTDLTDCETADLFIVAKKIQAMLEKYYGTSSSSVAVQDGPHAGQTVPHVHVHILPRKEGDFGSNPDAFYGELATHDDPVIGKKIRELDDMKKEAALYRRLLKE